MDASWLAGSFEGIQFSCRSYRGKILITFTSGYNASLAYLFIGRILRASGSKKSKEIRILHGKRFTRKETRCDGKGTMMARGIDRQIEKTSLALKALHYSK